MRRMIFFVIGGVCAFFVLLAPVHELGHWIAAVITGHEAKIVGWGKMVWYGTAKPLALLFMAWAGVVSEIALAAFNALRRRKKHGAASWFLGYAVTAFLLAWTLSDMGTINNRGVFAFYWTGFIIAALWIFNATKGKRKGGSRARLPEIAFPATFKDAWEKQAHPKTKYTRRTTTLL